MKNLFYFALLSWSIGSHAQDPAKTVDVGLKWEADYSFRDKTWPVHRACPLIADFNSDGLMDVYYGGTSSVNGWECRGTLVTGHPDGSLTADFEPIMDTEYTYKERHEKYVEFDPVTQDTIRDEGGKPIWKDSIILGTDGKPLYDTIVSEKFVGMKNGLPLTAMGSGSQIFDFNQDGFVDFLFMNTGGHKTGTTPGYLLIINKGNGHFETLQDSTLSSLACSGNDRFVFNEGSHLSSIDIGDYDKDGYPDVVMQGYTQQGYTTRLLHNEQGKGFKDAHVFHPLPFDVEVNRKGLYEEIPPVTDDEGNIEIPGDYTQVPTMKIKQMSHGALAFIDWDNDGWLDIITVGFCEGSADKPSVGPEPRGDEVRFYLNLKNGEFQDATDQLIAQAGETLSLLGKEPQGNLTDVFGAWSGENIVFCASDYDQDGRTDLMIFGPLNNRGRTVLALLNTSEEDGVISFSESSPNIVAGGDMNKLGFYYIDLNADDIPDVYQRIYCDEEDPDKELQDPNNPNSPHKVYSWSRWFSVSNGQIGQYTNRWIDYWANNDNLGAYIEKGDGYSNNIWHNFGDLNNDNKMDVFAVAYSDRKDDVIPSYSVSESIEPVIPDMPQIISAEAGEGTIEVIWNKVELQSGGDALYNVYVKNKTTGQIFMTVPALIENGKQLSYAHYGMYVNSRALDEVKYEFQHLPAGEYEVGVQSVGYSYMASEFARMDVNVIYGNVENTSIDKRISFEVDGNEVTLLCAEKIPVKVYEANGALIKTATTNNPIAINGHGLFLFKAGSSVIKIAL